MARQVSSGPHSITTAPSLTTCRSCNSPVLAATVRGLDEHVDTATLNDAGELAALLDGRRTFSLVAEDYLSLRTALDIAAGPPKRPVLAQHGCRVVPDTQIAHEWTLAAVALVYSALGVEAPSNLPAEPPF